jgi:hypothetical protein
MKSTINFYGHPLPRCVYTAGRGPFYTTRTPYHTLERLGLLIKLTRTLSNLLSSISYGDRGLSPPSPPCIPNTDHDKRLVICSRQDIMAPS